ncbi:hypothetical protein [Rufibacter immobilis]|uniref:hypothetical protein n=1 Tax=Rufibacter immobilis TaxID=1348778 RepID=UPI0035E859CA
MAKELREGSNYFPYKIVNKERSGDIVPTSHSLNEDNCTSRKGKRGPNMSLVDKYTSPFQSIKWNRTSDFDLCADAQQSTGKTYAEMKKEAMDQVRESIEVAYSQLTKKNIFQAGNLTAAILKYMEEQNLQASDAFMKVGAWDDFEVLITVPKDTFRNLAFKEVYKIVFEAEATAEEHDFSLQYTFCPFEGDLNYKAISADGFNMHIKVGVGNSGVAAS